MFLSKLIILNNKSCKKIILEPSAHNPEILIGINDSGKSTILKSLDMFFDEKKPFSFIKEDQKKNDLSNSPLTRDEFNKVFTDHNYPLIPTYKEDAICILVEFKLEQGDFEDKEFQDSTKNLHLKWSIGNGNKVTILRICQNNSIMDTNINGHYILLNDYKNIDGENLEAWAKNKTDLKKIRDSLEITNADISSESEQGPCRNIEEIRAIYNKVKSSLKQVWSPYKDFSKDKSFFPSFKYLDWIFSLEDLEELANEAMNDVTEPLLQEIKDLAIKKQIEALEGVNNKFNGLMSGLKDELPQSIKNIKSSVFFNVTKKITDITLIKDGSDGDIHLENQGEGIKRQIWFAILKWRSKTEIKNKRNKYIWCFDEPETHLYPSAQRELFTTFRDMCTKEFQILISTHSTVFIDRTQISNINKVSLEHGYSIISKAKDVDDIFDSLGIQNSDFLFYDKFIAVEGYTEVELIPYLYKLKYGRTLINDGIQIINLKGESNYKNNKEVLEKILSGFQKPKERVFYLLDNDTSEVGDNVIRIGIYDIEDSISNDIWIKFLQDNCGVSITSAILDSEVRAKLSNKKNLKFHALLSSYVASKKNDQTEYLPGKYDCGILLTKYFHDKNQIPESIIDFFGKLHK